MLSDITATLILTVLTAGLSVAGYLLAARRPSQVSPLLTALVILGLIVHAIAHGTLLWTRVLPFGGYVLWASIAAPVFGFAAGLAPRLQTLPLLRRHLLACSLAAISILLIVLPSAGPRISTVDNWQSQGWRDGVCLQSTEVTCCPAAASTLLRQHGIAMTERTLSEYCLTTGRGTSMLGLYAGLRRATAERGYDVRIHRKAPTDPALLRELPALALVHFSDPPRLDRSQILGRNSDEGHAVVVLQRFSDGTFSIADPATGLQRWSTEDLQRRWSGTAFSLASPRS